MLVITKENEFESQMRGEGEIIFYHGWGGQKVGG